MNLHGLASPVIGAINPLIPITIKVSTGYSTSPDGTRVPAYNLMSNIMAQMQALQYNDLQKVEGLNLQGERRKIYVNGTFDGVVRAAREGGDIIATPDGKTWLLVLVLEYWPDWTCFAMTLQADGVSFLGFIVNTTLVVTQLIAGKLAVGQFLLGTGVAPGTVITGLGTGIGAEGSYAISPAQTVEPPSMFAL